jgi:hypothetical protein
VLLLNWDAQHHIVINSAGLYLSLIAHYRSLQAVYNGLRASREMGLESRADFDGRHKLGWIWFRAFPPKIRKFWTYYKKHPIFLNVRAQFCQASSKRQPTQKLPGLKQTREANQKTAGY